VRERVVITGIGCISSFGLGHAALADAVASGASGISAITAFDTSACRSHLAATIRGFDPAAFIPPMKLRRFDAVSRVAVASARLLFEHARREVGPGAADDVGIALGTYTAGLDSVVEYVGGLTDHGPTGVPAILFSNTVSNAPASLCAIEFGLRGPNVTFNLREASSPAAIAFAVGVVRDRRAAAMVCGGADCVEETFFKVHDRFRALSPMRDGDEGARPFDRRRNGYVLGEGGYLLLLEAKSAAERRGAQPYGEVLGVGAAASAAALNDWPADRSGVVRAMRLALTDAGLAADNVGAVVAASNGAPRLDKLESDAIADVFGARTVPVASVKGAVGESGAAAAAGIVLALRSMAEGSIVPTVGLAEPDPECAVAASGASQAVVGETFLVNAVACGGTAYSLAIRAARA